MTSRASNGPRILVALMLISLLAVALTGCVPKAAAKAVAAAPKPMGLKTRQLAAGDFVSMRNGLAFTVPSGWKATLLSNPDGAMQSQIAFDGIGVTEYLVLDTVDPSTAGSITIESCWDASVQVPESYDTFREVASNATIRVFVGSKSSPTPDSRLYQVRTAVPHAVAHGLVLFSGSAKNPIKATRAMWGLLRMQGVSAP